MKYLNKIFTTNEGYKIVLIKYVGKQRYICEYEDLSTVEAMFGNIKKGQVKKPTNRLGEKWLTNSGYSAVICKYNNSLDCDVVFEDGTIVKSVQYEVVKSGRVINPNFPILYGVGYLGQGKYKTRNNNKRTIIYNRWSGVIERTNCSKFKEKHPAYKDVTVCEEWKCFQNFAEWFEENWKPWMDSEWHLDKDVLVRNNRLYSPETCAFVPRQINNLFLSMYKNTFTGVQKVKNRYQARISKDGKTRVSLGYFDTIEEAFKAYKVAKEAWIKEVADKWRGQISEKVYQSLYNYQVTNEITNYNL